MNNQTIYDRKDFCDIIRSLIEECEETKVLILHAPVGVGKSSVCQKVKKQLESENEKQVIRIISTKENKNTEEGAFFKNIFNQIYKYYDKKSKSEDFHERMQFQKWRFVNYLRRKKSFSIILQCVTSNSDNMIKYKDNHIVLFLYGIKVLLESILLKIGIIQTYDTNMLNDEKIMADYIKYVLTSGNIVLNIEDVQNFDIVSLNDLVDCLMETKEYHNFLLLEFTIAEDNSNYKFLMQFEREFKNADISVKSLPLENLEIEYVIKIAHDHCENKDECFDTIVHSNYTKRYNGNLRKVEDFSSIYEKDICIEIDPTLTKLSSLSKKRRYILALIIINNGSIRKELLKYIINNTSNDFMINFESDIESFLQEEVYIKEVEDNIKITHTSIINVWQENFQVFKKYELIAYRNCLSIYSKILNNNLFYTIPKNECLLSLFQLYNRYDIKGMSKLLHHIDEVIYDFLSVDELANYIRKLIEAINLSHNTINYLYKIIDICIKFQLYDVVGYGLQKIFDYQEDFFSERFRLYQYIKMFQAEEYCELLELINQDKKLDLSNEFTAYNVLFEIVTNRTLNKQEEYSDLVDQINNNSTFKNSIHYAYFLRLAEAYDKRNFAIPKVEESIKLFEQVNLSEQAAKSQVSLAFLYAVTGRIKDAKTQLDLSEKILLKNIQNKYVFNINKACIQLLSGDYSDTVWNMLDDVEKCTRMRFDRIAIIINKLVYCIENSKYVKGTYLQNKGLELLETETDKHIHAIFYYNCYLLNEHCGDVENKNRFYKLAYQNRKYCETLKARMENKSIVTDNTTFLLSKPWHVCFVSYWYFDYLNDLK